jgi:hypothetical protein
MCDNDYDDEWYGMCEMCYERFADVLRDDVAYCDECLALLLANDVEP